MLLEGHTALITGGTGALGHVVAERFLQEGCRVATSYLFEDELKRLSPRFRENVLICRADVTEDEDVVALFHQVEEKAASVSILINIVGGFLPRAEIKDVKTKEWDQMMDINLRSVFLCSREFLTRLKGRTYGRIISMAAMPALRPTAGRGPYAIAKGGVVMLTQILGEELKGTGVTANCIAPSILRTEANIASMPGEDGSKWVAPEEIAELMLLLATEKGRSVNGTCIPVFGGV
jgi:NAD(P)-dependent dehydrogenase (short-subunit alcohol dehydrogenase family)